MTLKSRILLSTIPINVIAIICIYLIVRANAFKSMDEVTNEHTRSLLSSAMISIENQYTSLEFHRQYAMEQRKQERQQIVSIATGIIDQYYSEYRKGNLDKSEAQRLALEKINAFRYDKGNGYIWINDTVRPIPHIIIHPIYPQYNNKVSSDPMFFTSRDSINVPRLALDLCEKQGSGFINYFWSKPEQNSDSIIQSKTSYVELYEPWGWILGAGIYLDDIEEDAANRLEAILEELKQTMGKMHLGSTGYFFIFNSDNDILLHPVMEDEKADSLLEDIVNRAPMDEIILASKREDNSMEYYWNSPLDDKFAYDHKKKVYVKYFEPLDWYVCASFYRYELEEPAMKLGKKILYISAIFILISLIVSLYISNSITKPLEKLMNFVARTRGDFGSVEFDKVPISGSRETTTLGNLIKDMLISLQKQQENLIEEKMKAQESAARLRDSEEKFRTLYESSNDAIFLMNNGKVESCNKRTEVIFKCDKDQIIGKTPGELSPEFQRNGKRSDVEAKKLLKKALQKQSLLFDWLHMRPGGDTFDASISLSLVELGKEAYIQATVRDISEQKKVERELEDYRNNLEKLVAERTDELKTANRELQSTNEAMVKKNSIIDNKNRELNKTLEHLRETQAQLLLAEKMASLGILTAGVAHEINNPLNYVKNGAKLLEKSIYSEFPTAENEYKALFEAVFEGIKRITKIVKSLGKYSHTKQEDFAPCNVHEILDNCLTILHHQYKDRIEIKKNLLDEPPLIKANEGELHQAFINLLLNAIHAISKEGVIIITSEILNNKLKISINDNGKGIDNEELKHIFDPFYTTKAPGEGTGLGLSITRKLIENHHGEISCESEAGKGSTFSLFFPV